jgi:peptidoglycan/LPS O-acetylase OafA/YrhL
VLIWLMTPVYTHFGATLPQNALTLILAAGTLAISLPLAVLMFHVVEKPALSLKDWVRTGRPVRAAEPAASTAQASNPVLPAP